MDNTPHKFNVHAANYMTLVREHANASQSRDKVWQAVDRLAGWNTTEAHGSKERQDFWWLLDQALADAYNAGRASVSGCGDCSE